MKKPIKILEISKDVIHKYRVVAEDGADQTALSMWLVRFGLNFYTSRARFKSGSFDQWEMLGLCDIMRQYTQSDGEDIYEMFDGIQNKWQFYNTMQVLGLSQQTAQLHFLNKDFPEWQVRGMASLIHEVNDESNFETEIPNSVFSFAR